jgi:hypothetical protein
MMKWFSHGYFLAEGWCISKRNGGKTNMQTELRTPSIHVAETSLDPGLTAPVLGGLALVTIRPEDSSGIAAKPEYTIVEEKIAAMQAKFSTAYNANLSIYENSDPTIRHAMDAIDASYATMVSEHLDKGEKPPSVSELFSDGDGLPKEYTSNLIEQEQIAASIEDAQQKLELYAPQKAASLKQQTELLIARIDYDKSVLAAFATRPDKDEHTPRSSQSMLFYDICKVIRLQQFLEAGTSAPYADLASAETSLQQYETDWRQLGLLRDTTSTEATPHVSDEQIRRALAHVDVVHTIKQRYSRKNDPSRTQVFVLQGLAELLDDNSKAYDSIREIFIPAASTLNTALKNALKQYIVGELGRLPDDYAMQIGSDEYTQLTENARKIDGEAALERLDVVGDFAALPFDFSEADLKEYLVGNIPPIALSSLKRISFRELTAEESKEDTTLGIHRYSKELAGSEIVISTSKIAEHYSTVASNPYGDKKQNEENAKKFAKILMLRTISHEFGHELHDMLTAAALARWEEKRQSDPTFITKYVQSMHESDHRHRYMEDFADTLSLFLNMPDELRLLSPVRYAAMEEIYADFMPNYETTTKLAIEERVRLSKSEPNRRRISDDVFRNYLLENLPS